MTMTITMTIDYDHALIQDHVHDIGHETYADLDPKPFYDYDHLFCLDLEYNLDLDCHLDSDLGYGLVHSIYLGP